MASTGQTRPPATGTTIQAVADAAGVSKTTVSHVLSGKRPVSAATRRRVERVMEQLNFQPNFFARALSSNRSHAIALIVQDITNPYYPALARGLQRSVAAEGQVVVLFDGGAESRSVKRFIDDSIQRRVDGVVAAASDVAAEVTRLQAANIPVVAVGSAFTALHIDWVSADDVQIAADAVLHLHATGRRRIATIAGTQGRAPGDARLSGFLSTIVELGLDATGLTVVGEFTRDGGRGAMQRLLDSGVRPDAVFCANDLMAIGAMEAIAAAGLSVPDDIAVIGVDDIDAASLVNPALTTVRIPVEEIGRAAGELLMHRVAAGTGSPSRQVLVRHELVIRASA